MEQFVFTFWRKPQLVLAIHLMTPECMHFARSSQIAGNLSWGYSVIREKGACRKDDRPWTPLSSDNSREEQHTAADQWQANNKDSNNKPKKDFIQFKTLPSFFNSCKAKTQTTINYDCMLWESRENFQNE